MKGIALGLCQWNDGLLWYQGKIWTPKDEGIRTSLIAKHHKPPQAGYGGTAKTTVLISRRYYWPKIREDIKRFIKNWDTCQTTKVVRHAPYGLLESHEAPDRPWQSIAMDFITDLPKSEGHDTILVVIDRLIKMSHFIPYSKDLDARQFANLFMKEIVWLHGLPHDIITDRGSLFTSALWKGTTGKLGIERRLSPAFHKKTNGPTERTNAILEQYLRAYINYQQDDWCGYLPLAEFAYNNGYQETIDDTPFFANYRINPEYEMIGHLIQGIQTKREEMTQLHESLRNEMVAGQLRQKEYYDLHRKPDPNLPSGDIVWLLPCNIKTTRPSKKLDYKKIRPFQILAEIGTSAYKLALPPSMAIHNTFHISLLDPYQDNRFPSQIKEPPPPIQIEGEDEYEDDEITDSRLHYNKLQYRAQWKGSSTEHEKVWYPGETFNSAEHTVQQFHRSYPGTPGVDTRHDQNIDLCTTPVVKQERRSHTPESDAQRIARNATPTSPEYLRSPKREVADGSLNWMDCTDDGCQIHLGEKNKGQGGTHNSPGDRGNQVSPMTSTGDMRWKRTQERTGSRNSPVEGEPEGLITKSRAGSIVSTTIATNIDGKSWTRDLTTDK